MGFKRTFIATTALSAVILSLGMSPAGSESLKADPPPTPGDAAARRAAAVEQAGQRASTLAESRGALGSYYDEASDQHVVVVSRGSKLAGADVSRAIGAAARVEQRDISKAKVDNFQSRVAQRAFHPEATSYSYASYYDLVGGKLVLDTDAPAAVVESLSADFAGDIEVRKGGVVEDFSRQADISPFWGGAAIKNAAGAVCSSGFVVKKSTGTRYMITAGHCYSVGTNVLTRGGNVSMGTVVQRAPIASRDMELIGGKSYGRSVYVGGTNSSTGKTVTGAANPVVGTTGYCRSGQTTGEKCGQKVISITANFCPTSGCKTNTIAYNTGGASAGGDSGAPFYWPGSSTVSIRGMHVGRNTSTGTMFAERWSTIANTLAVTIVT